MVTYVTERNNHLREIRIRKHNAFRINFAIFAILNSGCGLFPPVAGQAGSVFRCWRNGRRP
jgi:hypothetical protein